jgi:maleylacetoacetate isomerase
MALKGLKAEEISIDLLKGKQNTDEYLAVNPQGVVPALILDEGGPPLFQSLAILEYLEETHPQPPLLPKDPLGRARVRGIAQIFVSDSHPMSVPRIRNYLTGELKLDNDTMLKWVRHWQNEALRAAETHLSQKATGKYCHGDTVTLADVCLAGQVVGSGFFDVDVKAYPNVSRIYDSLMQIEAFAKAHPLKQPGAPASISH